MPTKDIIHRLLDSHIQATPHEQGIETFVVCDDHNGHYLLMEVGWQPPRRVYNVIFHLRLKENKIWVEQDWTE